MAICVVTPTLQKQNYKKVETAAAAFASKDFLNGRKSTCFVN